MKDYFVVVSLLLPAFNFSDVLPIAVRAKGMLILSSSTRWQQPLVCKQEYQQ
jgi:hypothetical protein